MGMKKGVFFTIDAIIGAIILITGIILLGSFYMTENEHINADYSAHDIINVLSTLKLNEINNSYVKELIASGEITNQEKSIIEQIGEFCVLNKTWLCENLTKNVTASIIPENIGFSVIVGGNEVYSRNSPTNQTVISARRMISGYENERPVKGSTARAYLKSIKEKTTSSFAYFGGFVGQGNISRKMEFIPEDAVIEDAFIELDAGGNFDLYVNGIFCGSFNPVLGNMSSTRWNITLCNFQAGIENNLSIIFKEELDKSYIAGGYAKATYTTSEITSNSTPGISYYYFPGIDGLINLYSSFDIPGNLNYVDLYLHFYNNKTTFLNIGNETAYSWSGSDEEQFVYIEEKALPFPQKTIPIRLGTTNISETLNITSGEPSDSVLVTDVSGSMSECEVPLPGAKCRYECCVSWFIWCWDWETRECEYADSCSGDQCGTCSSGITTNHEITDCQTRLDLAKNADLQFVDTVLNMSGNKIGLASYSTSADDYVEITDNKDALESEIEGYEAEGGTCICCGINRAKDMVITSENKKFILVMSDGQPTYSCNGFSDYEGSGTRGDGSGGSSSEQDKQWAIDSGQHACNNNITVFAVAFGEDADHETMKQIACNESLYYNASEVENLTSIYEDIGEQILVMANYSSQIMTLTGRYENSILYPDSYIKFNFTSLVKPASFGEIDLAIETEKFDGCTNNVKIPNKLRIIDAKVLSYSGSHWTSMLEVNENLLFNITEYGSDYRNIGDPFILRIPPVYLTNGSNTIRLQTADTPENETGCSENNSMIYNAAIKSSVTYSDVLPNAEGCTWTIETEDSEFITASVPEDYSGTNECSYTSSEIKWNNQDSISKAVYELLLNLDFDDNGKININIDEEDLEIETLWVSQVPYLWGPMIFEVRTWQ
jgi:hypothetical protein